MADDIPPNEEESDALKVAKAELQPFLLNNPQSSVIEVETDTEEPLLAIARPWGDNSLAIRILDENRASLTDALNNVLLPSTLTALYHRDAQRLEVIWTAFKLGDDQAEIAGREFEFRRNGKHHKCSFTKSSDRLLEIARGWVPLRNSESNWRNLRSFHYSTVEESEEDKAFSPFDEPRSFWVDNVVWDEEEVLELLRNLNFYLLLYDYSSPVVVIHPQSDSLNINPRSRYLWDMFPPVITAKNLDPNLVSFGLLPTRHHRRQSSS